MEIGPRLRAARTQRNISLRSLAQKTGFSASFLSQVELGQSSPSLASLQRICEALAVDLPELLRSPGHAAEGRTPSPVVRRSERQSIRSEWSKASAESLLPQEADNRISALLIALDAGGRTGPLPVPPNARQFAYCIRGAVRLTLGEELYELTSGDCVLLTKQLPSWENPRASRAEVLVVSMQLS